MDKVNLQLQEEVQALRKLREHFATQLRPVVDCDLPDDISALLDQVVELQNATQLHDLNENSLQEFYYNKQRELVENTLIIGTLQAEVDEQEQQLEKEQAECEVLEKFITSIKKVVLSEAEMERNKILLEAKMQRLKERMVSTSDSIPKDLNIDELILKIERLESKKPKEK